MAIKKTPAEAKALKPARSKAANVEAPIDEIAEATSNEAESTAIAEEEVNSKPAIKGKGRSKSSLAEMAENETPVEETEQPEAEPEAIQEQAPAKPVRKSKAATNVSLAEPETDLVDEPVDDIDLDAELEPTEDGPTEDELLEEDLRH